MGLQLGSGFGECSFAGLATPARDAAFAVVTESFAGLVLAFYTGHGIRCFLADAAVESAWVGIAAHSACRLPLCQLALTAGPYCVVDAARFGRASLSFADRRSTD
jgi:hypothetical protein